MRKIMNITTPVAAAAAFGTLPCAFAQQCPSPPFQPFPDGDVYIDTYGARASRLG